MGACVGLNGARVNAVVEELNGEKIDIINWDENPALLIENALSPAKVIYVIADPDEKTARVVVPDYQLSLAIGKEGQNARLAARLTGLKIDIKSETDVYKRQRLLRPQRRRYVRLSITVSIVMNWREKRKKPEKNRKWSS